MPVVRIDDEVMSELQKKAAELGSAFQPPNSTLRMILGLDKIPGRKVAGRFGSQHNAMSVKDTRTGHVYPSKYKAGLAFKADFPSIDKRYLWYATIHKYPGRFVEV